MLYKYVIRISRPAGHYRGQVMCTHTHTYAHLLATTSCAEIRCRSDIPTTLCICTHAAAIRYAVVIANIANC